MPLASLAASSATAPHSVHVSTARGRPRIVSATRRPFKAWLFAASLVNSQRLAVRRPSYLPLPTTAGETTAFDDNTTEVSALELRCLEIDIELRDVWEVLGQMPDLSEELHLRVAAMATRVAYDRGRFPR